MLAACAGARHASARNVSGMIASVRDLSLLLSIQQASQAYHTAWYCMRQACAVPALIGLARA
jgi:hypothetical protein